MTPQEFILMHAAQPYDPAKRREYYLKTRELKGRTSGVLTKTAPSKRLSTTVQKTASKASTSNREEIHRRREAIQRRVDELNVKLDKLRGILQNLDKQTGGKKPEESKTKEKKKELTPAEKKKAAKEAKDRRDKEAKTKTSPVQAVADIQKKIEAVQQQIREARIKIQQRAAKKATKETGSNSPRVSAKAKS